MRFDMLVGLFLIGGCGPEYKPDGIDDDPNPTDDTATDTDTTNQDCLASGPDWSWVVNSLLVTTADDGVDLDADGTVDNVLSAFATPLNTALATEVSSGHSILLVQFWDVQNWCDDAFNGGILTAFDTDGDPTDNFSGSETFDPADNVDASGHAVLSAPGTIAGGTYGVLSPAGSVEIGTYLLRSATPIPVYGVATPDSNDGVFGFGISVPDVVALAGGGVTEAAVQAIADLDSDGDGANDAVSVGFRFTAVPCGLP